MYFSLLLNTASQVRMCSAKCLRSFSPVVGSAGMREVGAPLRRRQSARPCRPAETSTHGNSDVANFGFAFSPSGSRSLRQRLPGRSRILCTLCRTRVVPKVDSKKNIYEATAFAIPLYDNAAKSAIDRAGGPLGEDLCEVHLRAEVHGPFRNPVGESTLVPLVHVVNVYPCALRVVPSVLEREIPQDDGRADPTACSALRG